MEAVEFRDSLKKGKETRPSYEFLKVLEEVVGP